MGRTAVASVAGAVLAMLVAAVAVAVANPLLEPPMAAGSGLAGMLQCGVVTAGLLGLLLGPRLARDDARPVVVAVVMGIAALPFGGLIAGLNYAVSTWLRGSTELSPLAPLGFAIMGAAYNASWLVVTIPSGLIWALAARLLLRRVGPALHDPR